MNFTSLKTRMVGLSIVESQVILAGLVLLQYQCVTDGRTDGRKERTMAIQCCIAKLHAIKNQSSSSNSSNSNSKIQLLVVRGLTSSYLKRLSCHIWETFSESNLAEKLQENPCNGLMNLAKSQLYNRSQITGWFSLVVTQNATATASTTAKLILRFWIRNWRHIATYSSCCSCWNDLFKNSCCVISNPIRTKFGRIVLQVNSIDLWTSLPHGRKVRAIWWVHTQSLLHMWPNRHSVYSSWSTVNS